MRWRYNDPPLVWLLVAAYLAHVGEEYFGGLPQWLAMIFGGELSVETFLVINALGLAVMIAAARLSTRSESYGWLTIGIATVVLVNGLLHLLGSVFTGTYSPGLITGIVLYVPLGQLALLRAWQQTGESFFSKGVAAGLAAHALVSLIAFTAVR
jgi:hypothetical protein